MALIDLAVLALLVLVAVAGWRAFQDRGAQQWAVAEAEAQWEDAHDAVSGRTRVLVRKVARLPTGETRVLGESVVDEIPDDDPDWHDRFSAARQIAYDRALDLNGPPFLT
jgi:hypothetical protein